MSSSLSPTNDEPAANGPLGRFIEELKRRKVVSTAGVYLFGAFVAMQVVDDVVPYVPFIDDVAAAGQIVFALLVIGFPIAMGLAWVLEITPPQVKRELTREEAQQLVDAAGPARKDLQADSVAVLPFENLSDDRGDAYFSDGITEDVITSIGQIRGLGVISRSSVMAYKGTKRSAEDVAGELGVATIVTGSVRRADSRIRVVAEVVDARTNGQLWSESFDRELGDIFLVQSEIASMVAHAVRRELSATDRRRIEKRGTTDPEAYDLYLQARYLWNQRSETAVADSVRYFQRALEHDPGFALAHSGLADAYAVLGIYGMRAPRDVLESARQSANTAVSLDPMLGEAVATQAVIAAIFDWNWTGAEAGFRRAIELAPSYPTAHQWYAVNVLAPQARFAEAMQQLERATALDPASSAIATSRAVVAFYARDIPAATAEFEALAELHPGFSLVRYFLGQCYGLAGNATKSIECLRRAVALADESSETLAALGHALAVDGQQDEASAILLRLEERSGHAYVSPALPAQVLIGLGRHDTALDRLEEATEARSTDLIWVGVRPVYDPLRETARFRAVVGKLGLVSRA